MAKVRIENRYRQEIVVEVDNQKKGNELVFIAHGLGGFKEQKHIETFKDAFVKAGYTTVRWDAANTIGESGGKMEDATLTNYFEDLEDVIGWAKNQEWYNEPFVVTGHSLGSACCVLYAIKKPAEVKALAPTSLFISGKSYYESLDSDELRQWKERGFVIQESASKPGVMKKLSWELMEDLLTYELFEEAKKIDKPTLLIVGNEDAGTPPSDQQKFLDNLSTNDKELHVIEGAPHTFKEDGHLSKIKDIIFEWAEKIK